MTRTGLRPMLRGMDDTLAAEALESAQVLGDLLSYLSDRLAEAIAQAVAAGLPEAQLAERLGMSAAAVTEALRKV